MNSEKFMLNTLQVGQPVATQDSREVLSSVVEQVNVLREGINPVVTSDGMDGRTMIGWESQTTSNTKPTYNSNTSGIKVVNAINLLNSPLKDSPKLWEPFLLSEGVAMLAGSSDVGKSSFLRQLAYAISCGNEEFLGHKLSARRRRALYVSTEDSALDVTNALGRLKLGFGDTINPDGLDFLLECHVKPAEIAKAIDEQLTKQPVDLVVIDAISDLMVGNPNDMVNVRANLNPLKALAHKHQCLFLLMHHTVKNAEKHAADKSQINGSQALEALPRCVIILNKTDVPFERKLTIVKANYLGHDEKKAALMLHFDESTLCFSLKGRQCVNENPTPSKQKFSNVLVFERFDNLRAAGLSFEKAHHLLSEEFESDDVPGMTTLKNYEKQKK